MSISSTAIFVSPLLIALNIKVSWTIIPAVWSGIPKSINQTWFSCSLTVWITFRARGKVTLWQSAWWNFSSSSINLSWSFRETAKPCCCKMLTSWLICAEFIVFDARSTTVVSNNSLINYASFSSSTRIGATKVPRCGIISTSPSSANRIKASRTGVPMTPSLNDNYFLLKASEESSLNVKIRCRKW